MSIENIVALLVLAVVAYLAVESSVSVLIGKEITFCALGKRYNKNWVKTMILKGVK